MYLEYYKHTLKSRMHAHFPDFERTSRKTIEDDKSFISVLREFHPTVQIETSHMLKMRNDFLAYLKRRSGSYKTDIVPCTGTIGRWGARRSSKPIMEFTFQCYDTFFYKNWTDLEILDRLVWNNVIPVVITDSYCPHGDKCGIIFIID